MDRRYTINRKSIWFFLLMLCVTAFYGANYFFSSLYTYDFMALTSLVLSTFIFILKGCKIEKSHYKSSNILLFFMWITGIIAATGYGLPVTVILKESLYTIVPLMMYLAFRPSIKSRKDISKLLHIISMTGMICNLVAFIEMAFALNGLDVLKINVFEKLRNGTPRFIIGETIITISFFWSCSVVTNRKFSMNKRLLHLCNIILTVINLQWIIKTRTYSLYLVATVLMIPVLNTGMKKRIRLFAGILVVGILAVVLLSNFVPSINAIIDNDYGIQMRFSMITYYLDYFKKHWLFGAGYVSANPYYSTYSIVAGPLGRYYTSDVGVIGLMFRNGIIGVAWLISWFYTSIKIIRDNINKMPGHYGLLIKLLIVFLLFSCINLILTDSPRFPYIALGMILVESSCLFENAQGNAVSRVIS